MGHKWKGTVEARKLRFLELYEDGASYQEIMTQLGLDEHDLRDWRATIRILGVSRFLRKLFKTPIFERWGKQFCLN